MAGKADFTEDEWKGLQQGVTGAGQPRRLRTRRSLSVETIMVSVNEADDARVKRNLSASLRLLVAHRFGGLVVTSSAHSPGT